MWHFGIRRRCYGARCLAGSVSRISIDSFWSRLYRWFPLILWPLPFFQSETVMRWHRVGFRHCSASVTFAARHAMGKAVDRGGAAERLSCPKGLPHCSCPVEPISFQK